jgi:hypothetical protein
VSEKPTSAAQQLLAQIQSVKDGWTLAERDEARAVALAWRPDDGDEYAGMKRLFFVDGWLHHCGRVALASKPAPSVEQDERGALDVSVLARLSAQIFDCPLNPTISKFARAVEANIRAASTSANVAQGAEAVAPVNFSPENWTAVFHTAFRHAGDSRFASDAHNAIELMDNSEWSDIVEYVLIAIKRALTAAQSASGDTKCD